MKQTPTPDTAEFYELPKRERAAIYRKLGWTLDAIADELELSNTTICRYLNPNYHRQQKAASRAFQKTDSYKERSRGYTRKYLAKPEVRERKRTRERQAYQTLRKLMTEIKELEKVSLSPEERLAKLMQLREFHWLQFVHKELEVLRQQHSEDQAQLTAVREGRAVITPRNRVHALVMAQLGNKWLADHCPPDLVTDGAEIDPASTDIT